jgi:ABC-2 type transport system permease protein
LHTFLEAVTLEINSIAKSKYKLLLFFLIPLFLSFFIISIFQAQIPLQLSVSVVDNDHSSLSSKLLQAFNASQSLNIKTHNNSTKEGIEALKNGSVYALIVIPKNFEQKVMRKEQPNISVFINMQYLLIGKTLHASISQTAMEVAGGVSFVQQLMQTPTPPQAFALALPMNIQLTPLFNAYKNYFYFLVTAILPSMWQILIIIIAIVTVAKLLEDNSRKKLLLKAPATTLFGTFFPLLFVYSLWGIMFLFYIYGVKQWHFSGDINIVVLGIILCVIAYISVGSFFYVLLFDYTETLSFATVYTAPAFAFLGVTFPTNDMNFFALTWREFLPITHLMELFFSQAHYATPLNDVKHYIYTLALFSILFFIAIWRIKNKVKPL